MSNVIPFPNKNEFSEKFTGKIPDQVLEQMLEAYDRVVDVKNQYPSGKIRVSLEDEEKAKKMTKDYEEYVLTLLTKILSLEAELCIAKYQLRQASNKGG